MTFHIHSLGGSRIDTVHDKIDAHIAELNNGVTSDVRELLHQLGVRLAAAGVWDKLSVLNVVKNDNNTDMLNNIVGPANATHNASTRIYSENEGFSLGNYLGQYKNVDTRLGRIAGIGFDTDDHSFFMYKKYVSGSLMAGSYSYSNKDECFVCYPSGSNGTVYDQETYAVNSTYGLTNLNAASTDGFVGFSRLSTTNVFGRINGSPVTGSGRSDIAPLYLPLGYIRYYGASNGGHYPSGYNQFAGWGGGAGLTTDEMAELEAAINQYMSDKGVTY